MGTINLRVDDDLKAREANRLHGLLDCYKIKLRNAGFRLVYQVQDQRVAVFVVAVGKREREQVYLDADARLDD